MNLPRTLLTSMALSAAVFAGTAAARDVFAPAPPPPPFLRGLERVDLNDGQRQQIAGILDTDRDVSDKLRDNAREAREAFFAITPGANGYQSAAEKFADAEAKAVRARILGEAQVRAKVYATLSDTQRTELASLPKPPDRDAGPGMGPGRDRGPAPGRDRGPRDGGPDGPGRGPGDAPPPPR